MHLSYLVNIHTSLWYVIITFNYLFLQFSLFLVLTWDLRRSFLLLRRLDNRRRHPPSEFPVFQPPSSSYSSCRRYV
ncbi:hypothetical protein QVD17_28581 [Tagetes erecta]|uniref:Uncharacterized protein n=1 Tax=Tagetes erecta TaxID=13708 RepID=A0AAD8KAW5_TARER|nr:hypothetical protein QVD17_28581 [Tagetes erecta]